MLKQKSELFVLGTKILLVGCKHISKSGDYEPTNSNLYDNLRRFEPDVIFVELDDFFDISWATHKTDTSSIVEYINKTNTPIEKYDLSKEHYNDVRIEAEYGSQGADKEYQKALNRRKQVKDTDQDAFHRMYEMREEKAAIEFIENIRQYNKAVIHCGVAHYPAHKNYLEYLSSI